jgi:hypothetical protein
VPLGWLVFPLFLSASLLNTSAHLLIEKTPQLTLASAFLFFNYLLIFIQEQPMTWSLVASIHSLPAVRKLQTSETRLYNVSANQPSHAC